LNEPGLFFGQGAEDGCGHADLYRNSWPEASQPWRTGRVRLASRGLLKINQSID
jgi:hypothetical protein